MNELVDAVQTALSRLRAHRTNMLAAWARDMLRLRSWLRYSERTGDRRLWPYDVADEVVEAFLTPNERRVWRELGAPAI